MSDTPSSPGTFALERALSLLTALIEDGGRAPLVDHAAQQGIPVSTAQRLAAAFRRQGFLVPGERGRYHAGLRIAGWTLDRESTITAAARPLLRRLARAAGETAHLAVLDGDMITYLVKEHGGGRALFTREGGQLEAYCSALGRVLLSHQPDGIRETYLAAGGFVPLTSRSQTDPDAIRAILNEVRMSDFAIDDNEVDDGLYCMAVPLRDGSGLVVAAISLSTRDATCDRNLDRRRLEDCARTLEQRLQ